jgi:hypothetical protein
MNSKLAARAPVHIKDPAVGIALLPLALLAGCASPAGDYPSLGIRDAERVAGTLEPVPRAPYVAPPPSAAVLGQAETLARAANEAHQAFLAEAPRASATVENARGAATGSENWARAEVALASLISARSRTMEPLADLDRLYVDAATEGNALAGIAAAREAVEAQVAAEDAAITRLQQALAR